MNEELTPEMLHERWAQRDKDVLWHPFTQQEAWVTGEPLVIERAEGCWLIDVAGRRYVDGVSSLWTNVHGHRHPRIDDAVRAQLDKMAHSSLLGLSHPPAIDLAERLVQLAPWGLSRVFYSDNGSTAVEVALKMAFQFHQQTGDHHRDRFARLSDAYHGDTLGAVSVGGIGLFHAVYKPLVFEAITLPAPLDAGGDEELACLAQALRLIEEHGERLAAFVFEPLVQGAAGMKMHSPEYLRAILDACREKGVLCIADEVAVGFGRTGSFFAMDQVGVVPDMMCVAKGLSGGYLPLAATLTTEAVYSAFLGAAGSNRQLFHGHTYTGNPLACAAAIATLEVFEEERTLEKARNLAKHLGILLRTRLKPLPWVKAIRQKGVMVGIDIARDDGEPFHPQLLTGHRVAMAARPHGAIVRPLGDTLVINPPLALPEEGLHALIRAVEIGFHDALGSL